MNQNANCSGSQTQSRSAKWGGSREIRAPSHTHTQSVYIMKLQRQIYTQLACSHSRSSNIANGKIKAEHHLRLYFSPGQHCIQYYMKHNVSVVFRLSFYLFQTIFYDSPSILSMIETNYYATMKAPLLINSLWIAFYLLIFDVQHLCKGLRWNTITAPLISTGAELPIICCPHKRGHPSENIDCLTTQCLCLNKKGCFTEKFQVSVCVHECHVCMFSELMGKYERRANQRDKGYRSWKRDNRNSIFSTKFLPNATALQSVFSLSVFSLRDREAKLQN